MLETFSMNVFSIKKHFRQLYYGLLWTLGFMRAIYTYIYSLYYFLLFHLVSSEQDLVSSEQMFFANFQYVDVDNILVNRNVLKYLIQQGR